MDRLPMGRGESVEPSLLLSFREDEMGRTLRRKVRWLAAMVLALFLEARQAEDVYPFVGVQKLCT